MKPVYKCKDCGGYFRKHKLYSYEWLSVKYTYCNDSQYWITSYFNVCKKCYEIAWDNEVDIIEHRLINKYGNV